MDNLKDVYDRIARDWHADHSDDDWWVEGTNAFISLLRPGSTILDAGCGGGTKSKYLSRKGFAITGIDFSSGMIEIAKSNALHAQFLVADMHDLESIDKKFDAVFSQASLLHIPKKEVVSVLQQFKKVLQPGGHVYVAVKGMRPGGPEEEVLTEEDYGYSYSRFFSYFTMEELKKYFEEIGMQICYEKIDTNGKTHWLQVVAK